MTGIDFRTRQPALAPSGFAGRFAFLEMADRKAMRRRPVESRPEHVDDPHRDPSLVLLEAWAPVEDELRQAVDDLTFRIWLDPVHPHGLIAGTWRLGCDERAIGWLRDRFGRLIESCAERRVEFVVCGGRA